MDERCLRPLFCTIKAELGRGQPGLMRWSWDEKTLPQCSISIARSSDRYTTPPHCSSPHYKWASGRPRYSRTNQICVNVKKSVIFCGIINVSFIFQNWTSAVLCFYYEGGYIVWEDEWMRRGHSSNQSLDWTAMLGLLYCPIVTPVMKHLLWSFRHALTKFADNLPIVGCQTSGNGKV